MEYDVHFGYNSSRNRLYYESGWRTPLWYKCCMMSKKLPRKCFTKLRLKGSLTRLRVETAGGQEVSGEVDVDITEEEQHVVAPPPRPGPHVQAPPAGELLIHLDQSEAPEPGLSEGRRQEECLIRQVL